MKRKLKDLRKSKGLTQEELAEKVGCTRVAIVYYETGYHIPRLDIAIKIAKILGANVEEIEWS